MEEKLLAAKALANVLDLNEENVIEKLETPKSADLGDLAFPTFFLAKELKKAPQQIAQDLVEKIDASDFAKVVATGPYINFFYDKDKTTKNVVAEILTKGLEYGANNDGQNGQVPIDMSSPNIAKPMSLGHLRSTVIGNAFANLLTKNGYKPVKINHLGDWGTQFGLMMAAYKAWGEKPLTDYSVDELVQLYVRINAEMKENEQLADDGRNWFKKLEQGDEEAREMWQIMRDASLKEFFVVYDRLGITFDSLNGEAFYEDKMQAVVDDLKAKGLLVESQGAMIVDLPNLMNDESMGVAMIQRTDGATLYITRDLAAAQYRKNTYDFVKSLYVVGAEQKEHFKQLKAVLKLAGYDWSDDMEHITFGLITFDGKKMSTRKGNVVRLADVLDTAHEAALAQINEKNPTLANKDEVAEQIGTGAIIFSDLMNDRNNSIDFVPSEAVKFEGSTGPYVQYTRARALSVLRKAEQLDIDASAAGYLNDENSWETVIALKNFPKMIQDAWRKRDASMIAKYALNLSRSFNRYYANTRILVDDENKMARLALVKSVAIVLEESLRLLGVKAPDEM